MKQPRCKWQCGAQTLPLTTRWAKSLRSGVPEWVISKEKVWIQEKATARCSFSQKTRRDTLNSMSGTKIFPWRKRKRLNSRGLLVQTTYSLRSWTKSFSGLSSSFSNYKATSSISISMTKWLTWAVPSAARKWLRTSKASGDVKLATRSTPRTFQPIWSRPFSPTCPAKSQFHSLETSATIFSMGRQQASSSKWRSQVKILKSLSQVNFINSTRYG